MAHPPARWSAGMQVGRIRCVDRCAAESPWEVAAQGIETTHLHLAITFTTRDISGTVKWLGQQMTKAVHGDTAHTGPVFCRGHWLPFIYDKDHWNRLLAYIGRHDKAADGIGGPPTVGLADGIDAFIQTIDQTIDAHRPDRG